MERKTRDIIDRIFDFILIAVLLMFAYGIFNIFRFFFLLKDYLEMV